MILWCLVVFFVFNLCILFNISIFFFIVILWKFCRVVIMLVGLVL